MSSLQFYQIIGTLWLIAGCIMCDKKNILSILYMGMAIFFLLVSLLYSIFN
jgi:hypothetical protein